MSVHLEILLDVTGTKSNSGSDFLTSLDSEESENDLIVGKNLSGPEQNFGFFIFFMNDTYNFQQENAYELLLNKANEQMLRIVDWINQRRILILNRDDTLEVKMVCRFFSEEEDSIKLMLPPEFLIACGEAKIPIRVAVNEY